MKADRSVLLLALLALCSCGGPQEDPLDRARRVDGAGARALLLEEALASATRGQAALILAGRFQAAALPWLEEALARYTPATWPDRSWLARALGVIPGAGSRQLLLPLAQAPYEWSMRRAAIKAMAQRTGEPGVAEVLRRVADQDPDPALRKEAARILAGG